MQQKSLFFPVGVNSCIFFSSTD